MSALRIIFYIIAAIAIIFGFLYVLAAFSPAGNTGTIISGLVLFGIGFIFIWLGTKQKQAAQSGENVTLKLDLPAETKLDSLKCQSCGGVLSSKNITMVAGAPWVTCPYCNTTYQLTEEPKW